MRTIFYASTIAVAACLATAAHAQETSSAIRGQVTGGGGAVVAGAAIVVTHVPSGTTVNTTTGKDGTFNAPGLRVGGPFTVKVSAPGYTETSVTDIQLTAGQPLRLPIMLESTGGDIVVTASRTRAVELSPGPITALTRRDIEGIASVKRDIRDLVRRDPFATIDPTTGGVSAAGQNARLNRFAIDGLAFSDNFGLNNGGLPTVRGPVPLDAIEQLSVKLAPYDISEGDFQGASINVILRSGTNTIHGSGFYTYTDDGLTGSKTRIGTGTPTGRINLDFKSRNYGGFISGPIIKDKLFIAASYERLKEGKPVDIGLAGAPAVVPNLTQAQVDQIGGIANSVYNYAAGGAQTSTAELDEKFTVKVDWNIIAGQRLSATWIHNKSNNGFTAGFSSTAATSPALALQSNNYLRPENVDSYVAELNSDWSSKLHSTIRANYRKYSLDPVPYGALPFSQMRVCLDPTSIAVNGTSNTSQGCTQGASGAPGTPTVYFGPDRFRHFNYVHTKQYGLDGALRWEFGNVSMKATAAWQHLDVANAFTSDALGTYYFDSIADLQARRASTVTLAGSITGDLNDVLASFGYDQFTFGLQSSWDPTPTLNITAGARVDMYGGTQAPPLNTYFQARYGISNQNTANGRYVAQPRIAATWSGIDNLRLRAGFGLFAGGSPNVFLGNSFSVAGVYGNSVTISRNGDGSCSAPTAAICNAALTNVDGKTFPTALTDYLRTNVGSISLANVNALDPNYKMQSNWKATASADYKANFLGGGWNFGGDLYYSWVNNAPLYKDLRLRAIGTMPDGRARYASTTTGANTDLLLTNSKLGHSFVLVGRADKSFDFGVTLGASYTYSDVKDQSAANGTTASGTYGQNAMVDPNIAAYGTSTYQIRNSWKFSFDYDHAFFGDYKTRLSLFGELRSGLPYSLTMNDPVSINSHSSVFGAPGASNRYLLYVPMQGTDALVVYDSPATQTALDNFISANGLSKYRGKIIPKNTQRAPQWFKVDLHVEQELPLPGIRSFAPDARVKLFADVENVLNIINKDWGSLRQVAFPNLASIVNVSCAATSGNNCTQYRYSNFSNPSVDNTGRFSLYTIRIGAKVQF
jgi:hypothetical protein